MRSAPLVVLTILLAIAPAAMAAWGMPDAINDRMQTIESIYTQILFVATIVFLVVFGWLVYNLVKFRPGGDGQATNEEHRGSVKAELVWTIIPLLIVAWVGVISFQGATQLQEEPENPAAEIDVVGFQWFWQFEYESGATIAPKPADNGSLAGQPAFYIPADEPVVFNITSGDVIHSFFIPNLGIKIDATPGRNTTAFVTAPEGEYLLQCAEMCGLKHAYMNAKIKAVPMDEYQAWLDENKPQQRGLQTLDVTLTDDAIEPSEIRLAASVEATLAIQNDASSARTVEIEGTNASVEIPAGASGTLNATLDSGEHTLASGGQSATLTALETEQVDAELLDSQGADRWAVDLSTTTFEVGKAYVFDVQNVGGTVHNLYLGTPEESGTEEIFWRTEDLDPGEATQLVVIPTEEQTGSFEAWCDIPGHYSLGMVTEITIQ